MFTKPFKSAVKKPLFLACTMLPTLAVPAAMAQNPYVEPDGSWISLSGEVTETKPETFTLDYGPDTVVVEMDDWDWYDESRTVLKGDKVNVYGRVDNDFYETASIEADSVYVQGLGTLFYANAVDEESLAYGTTWVPAPVVVVGDLTLTGAVKKVDGRQFTVDTGTREMRIDTKTMVYNPMDDKGFQKIKTGDVVRVTGDLEIDTFDKRELVAESVITLSKNERNTNTKNSNRMNNTGSVGTTDSTNEGRGNNSAGTNSITNAR